MLYVIFLPPTELLDRQHIKRGAADCGNDFKGTSSSDCTMLCSGNDQEICGGENAIQVYQNASFVQCYDGYHFIGSFAYVCLHSYSHSYSPFSHVTYAAARITGGLFCLNSVH
jgi:hypothetical protein